MNVGAITATASVVYLTADLLQGWGKGWSGATKRMAGGEKAEAIQKDLLTWQGFGELAGAMATFKWGKAGNMLGEGWRAEFARRGIGRSDEEIAADGKRTTDGVQKTADNTREIATNTAAIARALDARGGQMISDEAPSGWMRSGAGYGR